MPQVFSIYLIICLVMQILLPARCFVPTKSSIIPRGKNDIFRHQKLITENDGVAYHRYSPNIVSITRYNPSFCRKAPRTKLMDAIGFLEITASFFAVIIGVYSTVFMMTQRVESAASKDMEDEKDDAALLEEMDMSSSFTENVDFSGFEEYLDTDAAVDDTDSDAFLPQDKEVMVIEEIQDDFSSEAPPSETVDTSFDKENGSSIETLNETLSIQQEEETLDIANVTSQEEQKETKEIEAISAVATQKTKLKESVKTALHFDDDEEPQQTVIEKLDSSSTNDTPLQEQPQLKLNVESSGAMQGNVAKKPDSTASSSENLVIVSAKDDAPLQEQPLPNITDSQEAIKQPSSATTEKEILLPPTNQGSPKLEDKDVQQLESNKIEPKPPMLPIESSFEQNLQPKTTSTTVFKAQSEVSYKDPEVDESSAHKYKGLPPKKRKQVSTKQGPPILHNELSTEEELATPNTVFKLQSKVSPTDTEVDASSAPEGLSQKKAKEVNGKQEPRIPPNLGPKSTLANVFKLKSNASYKNAEEEAKAEAIIKQRQNDMEMVKRYVAQKEKDKLEVTQVLGNKVKVAKEEDDVAVIVPNLQEEKEINAIFLKKEKDCCGVISKRKRFLKKRHIFPAFLAALIMVLGRRLLFV